MGLHQKDINMTKYGWDKQSAKAKEAINQGLLWAEVMRSHRTTSTKTALAQNIGVLNQGRTAHLRQPSFWDAELG